MATRLAPGAAFSTREYATADLAQFAVKNKGLKAGPGGRSSISGVTATVFGCSGFLGRYIVNALARQGTQVVVPYRRDELDVQYLRQMGDLGQIYQWKDFNIRDDSHIKDAIKRSNVIINLTGLDKETWNFSFEDVHIDAATRIAQAAADNPLTERFVQFSCIGASENAASRRLRTKAAGDAAVRSILPYATVFKPGHVVGTEDRMYNIYATMAKQVPFIPLVGGGETKLQPTYVRDVADAVIHSLKTKEALGKEYFLAGPEVLTVKQIVELVYTTIREPISTFNLPLPVARLLAVPREKLFKMFPIPVNTMFTADYIEEMTQDHVLPPNVLTYADLEVVPKKVTEGFPIEHLRHYRVGGYDVGTTSGTATTGGAGYTG
ncbi:NAD(P)-binding protein [Coccomyxa subellipsoidea C-169]|uniref:NAD(P)-binding protein n=1 Tax=Coccomyxa subellipsoidea (strain C-169) TaxID=574566 RepID=I0Z7X6_COCSC|nr:NAD(P)-binding protein [Coccomyxa subellipsoidea C-169]EIE26745.1 NAD(P)-binding protein [Coccomyxa subellipsoidea C-169]|eukprot:XP_005651289.1 NAD(P)-binding protein [Coccomyxa subellipsoidea C-169]